MVGIKDRILSYSVGDSFVLRGATKEDTSLIVDFLQQLSLEDISHFHPFPFTLRSITHVLSCSTYQVYIVMSGKEMVGLFFLRFFVNSQCFLGYTVKNSYRGKGIGTKMIAAIAKGVQNSGFRLMSTICVDNEASIKAHMAAAQFEILETLPSNEIVLRLKD